MSAARTTRRTVDEGAEVVVALEHATNLAEPRRPRHVVKQRVHKAERRLMVMAGLLIGVGDAGRYVVVGSRRPPTPRLEAEQKQNMGIGAVARSRRRGFVGGVR